MGDKNKQDITLHYTTFVYTTHILSLPTLQVHVTYVRKDYVAEGALPLMSGMYR